jgi:hypothetical protein
MPRTSTAPQGTVGKEALSYCTSCKMDLNHTIVALKGDRIAKVHCLTCKKEHVYRAPKGITEPGQVVKKATRTRKKKEEVAEAVSVEAEWEKLMAAHRESPLKPYSTKSSFLLGDKLSHPTFGDGIVGKLIYPNKLEVIFRTDVKVLIHGGAQAV